MMYEEQHITLKNHRLSLFDAGFGIGSLIDLLVRDPTKYSYQLRRVLNELIYELSLSQAKTALVITSDTFMDIPILIGSLKMEAEIRYFHTHDLLLPEPKNKMAEDVYSTLPVFGFKDYLMLRENLRSGSHRTILLSHAQNLTISKQMITDTTYTALFRGYLADYTKREVNGLHFYFAENGFQVFEHADGGGEIRPFAKPSPVINTLTEKLKQEGL
jgi:hypothetical protein